MKCLVAIKQVVDPYVAIRVKVDNSAVETNNVKMAMNPFDEIAIEEAVRQKEAGIITDIIVISIGSTASQETLRQALARGADQAILVETKNTYTPLVIAKILSHFAKKHAVDLFLLGKQAIDDDCNQTGQMLAALLNWAQGTFVSSLKIDTQHKQATVVREVDGGLETLNLKLPAVITTDLRLNEPRYISLPNVMMAKRKTIEVIPLDQLDWDFSESITTVRVTPPLARKAGIKVTSVTELVDKLRNEAKVI